MIICPFCGARPMEEYAFRKTVPEGTTTPIARVYERLNRTTESIEHWQHLRGCRAWLVLRRDPSSGETFDVRLLQDAVV